MTRPEPADPNLQPDRRSVWTRYWSSGVLHSCTTSYAGNYDGAVERFWHRQFERLQVGDRVLDVGTGNGSLPLLLQSSCTARGVAVQCDAIDLAAIDPAGVVPELGALRTSVCFHPGTSVECLPFGNATFRLVSAQYALEYADPGRSLGELGRVLQPGGWLAVLAHHADSTLVRVADEELHHLELLLGNDGMLGCAGRLLPHLALAARPDGVRRLRADPVAEAARSAFNRAAQQTTVARDASAVPDLLQTVPEQIAFALGELPRLGGSASLKHLQRLEQDLIDARVRLQELRRFALDADGVDAWCARARAAGFELQRCEPLQHDDGALMAWAIEARRA